MPIYKIQKKKKQIWMDGRMLKIIWAYLKATKLLVTPLALCMGTASDKFRLESNTSNINSLDPGMISISGVVGV